MQTLINDLPCRNVFQGNSSTHQHFYLPQALSSTFDFRLSLHFQFRGLKRREGRRCEDPGTVDTKQQRQNSASNFIDVPQIDQLEREMSTSITCKNRIST